MKQLSIVMTAVSLILCGICLASWTFGHIDTASGLFTTASSLFCAAIARAQFNI